MLFLLALIAHFTQSKKKKVCFFTINMSFTSVPNRYSFLSQNNTKLVKRGNTLCSISLNCYIFSCSIKNCHFYTCAYTKPKPYSPFGEVLEVLYEVLVTRPHCHLIDMSVQPIISQFYQQQSAVENLLDVTHLESIPRCVWSGSALPPLLHVVLSLWDSWQCLLWWETDLLGWRKVETGAAAEAFRWKSHARVLKLA